MSNHHATSTGNIPFTAEEEAVWAAKQAAYAAAALIPTVPQTVTMRQARLSLLAAGKLAAVNSAIAGMTGTAGDAARIEWEFSSEVKRNQQLVISLGEVLGMTAVQLDDLFVAAAGL